MATQRSLRSLSALNFFVANVQTGFGPFIAVYLTQHNWTPGEIGVALSIGSITALVSQLPAGALLDAMQDKRRAVLFGVFAVSGTALLYAVSPTRPIVYLAEILHGFASAVLTSAIAAVSLTLVGRAEFGERVGLNARYASIGSALAAAAMGVLGARVSTSAVFWLTSALGVPALVALAMIGRERAPVVPGLADPAAEAQLSLKGIKELFLDHRLLIFAACILLFFLANAAMGPLATSEMAKMAPKRVDELVAATVIIPQLIVAILSPLVGRAVDRWGRRPIMLIGWAALPVQGVLFATLPGPYLLTSFQMVGGISAAVFGVTMALVAADLTRESGRFNLAMGALGIAVFVGATISTTLGGWMVDAFAARAAFLGLALIGLCGTFMIGFVMPETGKHPAIKTVT